MSQLQSVLFCKDTAGAMYASDPNAGGNARLFTRDSFTKESSVVQAQGPLMTDLNYLDRLILNGVRIGIKSIPNPESFSLMSNTKNASYKIKIIDHVLKIPHVVPSSGVLVSYDNRYFKQLMQNIP